MSDLARVRLLLDHGADVNARSKQGMSPLFIAAAHDGNTGVIRLLLERGADAKAPGPAGATAALIMAAQTTTRVRSCCLKRARAQRLKVLQAVTR
jgi:ankyrin repeat protein